MRPGHYIWEHSGRDHVRTQLTYRPNNKLDVAVWWNNQLSSPNILFWVPIHIASVKFGDLWGNGYGSPLHRVGLGMFVVNTAIQVLRLTHDPTAQITGILSNPRDDRFSIDIRNSLQEGRRKFWSRFGLEIGKVAPNRYESISGSVGKLKTVAKGTVAGQFPCLLPIGEFTYDGL